jgi:hypothetical protein
MNIPEELPSVQNTSALMMRRPVVPFFYNLPAENPDTGRFTL